MKLEIWDQRRCQVGEGPVAVGPNNNDIWWVDIYNSKVLYRNAQSGATNEYTMPEHVSFIIPCADGSDLLGTANGPVRRRKDGSIEKLQTRQDVSGKPDSFPERWNDAKVAPDGHLWLGSMPYDWAKHPSACGLYKLDKNTLKLTKEVDGINLTFTWVPIGNIISSTTLTFREYKGDPLYKDTDPPFQITYNSKML